MDGRAVEVGPARQRCVLAVLLAEANRAVSSDELFERVWAGRPPQHGRNALAGYLSRLRGVLTPAGGAEITYRHGGYQLRVDPLAVDLHAFGDLTARADLAEDGRQRLELLDEALGLWRGEPFASLNTPWFDEVRTRLDAQRLAAILDRNDAALACGRHAAMVGELSGLAAANPADERVAGQLMVALYLCGRQDEAIRRYHSTRGYLVEEFGVDPGPGLQDLYRRLLAADPSLAPGLGTVPSPEPTKHSQYGLPADVAVLAGRDKEIQTILDGVDNVDSADGRVTVLSIDGMPGVGSRPWRSMSPTGLPGGTRMGRSSLTCTATRPVAVRPSRRRFWRRC